MERNASETAQAHAATDQDQQEDKKKRKHRHRHHHHRRHRRKTITINFDLPGVVHVVISDAAQKYLSCVIGEHITAEKPWGRISKERVLEQIEMEMDDIPDDFLPFYKYKAEILEFPGEELLIGYIPDESREYDEFYLCATQSADETISGIVRELEEEQQARLINSINKVVRKWRSHGSEVEVDENVPRASRGYLRVELETNYPIMNGRVTFHERLVQQAKDGYVELKVPARYAVPYISKRRIDNFAQAAPLKKTVHVQTNYPFPKNTWTQYLYECEYEKITRDNKHIFINFFNEIMDPLADRLFMNFHVNMFVDDYANLISAEHSPQQKCLFAEKMSFKDIIRCKDKMISAIAWHPMWTGTVAIAYASVAPLWANTAKPSTCPGVGDPLWEAVHGQNPVLLWSFKDSLKPKLLLETNCEVHCLAFCPHNENLLIGGCVSGQVIVWDITNKLSKVEEVEILTTAQHKYRTLMFSMMKWMMNTRDLSIVQITAISNLAYSHLSNVTSVRWLHPLEELTKTGQLQVSGESCQFVTSSADGVVKFWDLKQKPMILPGEYRPQRKSKRFKTRPPALTTDVSQYRILNRKMLPHFQLNMVLPKSDKTSPLTFVEIPADRMVYEQVDFDPDAEYDLTDRLFFTPVVPETKDPEDIDTEFMVGTYLGDFVTGSWEGFEYASSDLVGTEQPKIVSAGKYHDGPVLIVSRHPAIKNLTLTVGGKVVAIWSDSLINMPVLWRRSKHKYTHGAWRSKNPCSFSLSRSDGNREIWNLKFKSDSFYNESAYSGKAVFEGVAHPRDIINKNVFGLSDSQGTLRVITISEEKVDYAENVDVLQKIINATIERHEECKAWQKKWVENHASWILEQREAARREAQRIKEEQEAARKYEEEMKAQEAAEAAKKTAVKQKGPPGKSDDWAQEQFISREQERMGNVLLAKKRLDRDTLVKQQVPLKRLEAELEKKRHRQRSKLQKADQIFNDTIKMLFPDLLAEGRSATRTSNVSQAESEGMKIEYFAAYNEMKEGLDEDIEENPYTYKFSWRDILSTSKQKKKLIDFSHQPSHKIRYEDEVRKRAHSIHQRRSEAVKRSVEFRVSSAPDIEIETDLE